MPYDITGWNGKPDGGLSLALRNILSMPDLVFTTNTFGNITISGPLHGFHIEGLYNPEAFEILIDKIELKGLDSGNYLDKMKTILTETTGKYSATLIWNDGESISKITADDGVVGHIEIEI